MTHNHSVFYDTPIKMYCYRTSKEDLQKAEDEYQTHFSKTNILNHNTIYAKKESRMAGILGEIVFKNIYPEAEKADDITYDFKYNNHKLDVKCKYRTVKPSLNFEASFFLYQATKEFNADYYYFMSTIPSYQYVWLCGTGSKKFILEHPNREIWRAGEVDGSNGMAFKEDTLCLKYKYMNPVSFDAIN